MMLAALILGITLSTAEPTYGELLDRVVVVVDGEAVTESELRAEIKIARVRLGGVSLLNKPITSKELRATRLKVVQILLIAREARRSKGTQLSEADLDEAIAKFAARFESPTDYRDFLTHSGISEVYLRVSLGRWLAGMRIFGERERYWAAGAEGEERRKRLAEGSAHWLEVLRARATIRVLGMANELELEANVAE